MSPRTENVYTRLRGELRAKIDVMREKEDRSLASMISILLEEAVSIREGQTYYGKGERK